MARLKEKFDKELLEEIKEEFKYKNINQVPKLVKVVVNVGVGEAIQNAKALDHAIEDVKVITGQMPVITRARKAIANFKLRTGMAIGCCVTLRGERMYEFFDRLVNVALPRVRDFKGVSPKSFDGFGNYSLGIKEQVVFPEIDYDNIDKIRGMNISIVTTAKTDAESKGLLKKLGMPFRS
jgi:large subunit ribosomal protein L5